MVVLFFDLIFPVPRAWAPLVSRMREQFQVDLSNRVGDLLKEPVGNRPLFLQLHHLAVGVTVRRVSCVRGEGFDFQQEAQKEPNAVWGSCKCSSVQFQLLSLTSNIKYSYYFLCEVDSNKNKTKKMREDNKKNANNNRILFTGKPQRLRRLIQTKFHTVLGFLSRSSKKKGIIIITIRW